MFNFRPPTGVPGFRVGLEEEVPGFNVGPDGSVRSTGSPDAPPYGYYPYGDVTPTSVDPRGAGTDPPDFLQSQPWPARPRLETAPRPNLGPGLAPPHPRLPRCRRSFGGLPGLTTTIQCVGFRRRLRPSVGRLGLTTPARFFRVSQRPRQHHSQYT